jgi:proteasome lid subunit RPN8/RPN11
MLLNKNTMESVHIPRKLINQILEQAQQSPNKEICGLLSSHVNNSKQPVNCYPVANTSTEPNHRYLMDPRQQIDTFRVMRERGEELYAIYHSHPQSPASPSAEDLRQASYPEALHIIISMSTTGTLQLRGFRLKNDSITAVDIAVE